ncbi:MAG TPA: T9SS type A sorting domain-containing protein [Bacteroidia bacterium]|nr:T9SS type A sorting domain-containing protein [Bacteroidia bacterium]
MKITTIFTLALNFALGSLVAQNYGENLYLHSSGGTRLCDALTISQHSNNPGYLMAGYKALSQPNTYNFALDRTLLGGACTGVNGSFQKVYQIHANLSEECEYNIRPVLNCAGVSVIETDGPMNSHVSGITYALAGAFSSGCFFSLLDQNGNPVMSTSFIFPSRNYTTVTQPKLMECSQSPGDYIICGGIDRTMYALRINSAGAIIWSHFYAIEGEVKDMIPAAFGPNKNDEFVLVGKSYYDYANSGIDGFLMLLNQSSGNVVISRRVHIATVLPGKAGDQYFNTITPVVKEYPQAPFNYNTNPFGYLVGGFADQFSFAVPGNVWHYRCDSNLVMQASDIYTLPNDSAGGEIVDIVGRKRINSNIHDYYMLCQSATGMDVIRTVGFTTMVYPLPFRRQFHYVLPGQVPEAGKIGMLNNINSPYSGLQLYGTDNTSGYGAHYLIKSYFSGETSCNSSTLLPTYCNTSTTHLVDAFTPYGGLVACPQFMLTNMEEYAFFERCGPDDSLNGGSNMRAVELKHQAATNPGIQLNVYPNPAKDQSNLEYHLSSQGQVNIALYDMLGRSLFSLVNDAKSAGTHTQTIDLKGRGLRSGIYFLRYDAEGQSGMYKLLYDGE